MLKTEAEPLRPAAAPDGRRADDGAGSDLILERLKALHPKVIDLSLGRIRRLLATLGHPERALPPVVHVAGTNGKGSTLAFMRAMLQAGGYRAQSYISPHLVRFRERILLAQGAIAEDGLAALLEECEAANRGEPITFFEITSAAAFLAFAREPADVLLLETGLGGRLDATNVVARPALTAICPVSHDHHHYLGETLAKIAAEKAGILKPGVPAVVGRQPAEAARVIAARARRLGAPLLRLGAEWRIAADGSGFVCEGPGWRRALPAPGLLGEHQRDNAGLAVACLESLSGFGVDAAALARGLETVHWPARLQRLVHGPLPARLPEGWEIWLDGGHNPSAGEALAVQAGRWAADGRPLHIVFGMLNSKSPEGFLGPLAPYAGEVRAVAVPGEPASLSAEEAARAAEGAGVTAAPAADVAAATDDILARAPAPARLLICGSLYLAGTVLRENG